MNMRKVFIVLNVALAAVAAVSCGQAPKNLQVKNYTYADSTAYSHIAMDVDLPSGSGTAEAKITGELLKVTDDILSRITSYEEERFFPPFDGDKKDVEAFLKYYLKQASGVIGSQSDEDVKERTESIKENENIPEEEKAELLAHTPTWVYDFSLKKIGEGDSYVVFQSQDYINMGGAHGGVIGKGGLTFNKKNGERVEHLIDRDKEADIQPLLVKGVISYFADAGFEVEEEKIGEYISLDGDLIPLPKWEPYPSEKGLVFTYQQYEIASYAAGMPSFTVSFSDAAPFMTPECKKLLGLCSPKEELTVKCIWDQGYSAFPSIVRFQDAYYVSFREGAGHVFDENGIAAGKTRILRSTDCEQWESVALLSKEGYDLRDPKLSVTADGRLMVIQGGSMYVDKELKKRVPQVSFSSDGHTFSDPEPVDYPVPDGFAWFWRMTWHEGTGYTVSYGESGDNRLELIKTTDGRHFEKITDIELGGFPNETTVRFLPDGRMALLIRREQDDQVAYLGVSEPPFTDWKLTPLGFHVGGPEMVVLPDGSLIIGGRGYLEGEPKTHLWRGNAEGDFELWKTLPSGGDNSYPGFLVEGRELKVVYYSSHELTFPDGRSRAGIYLARMLID